LITPNLLFTEEEILKLYKGRSEMAKPISDLLCVSKKVPTSNRRKEEEEEKGGEIEGKQWERADFIRPEGQFFEIEGSKFKPHPGGNLG